MACGNLSTGFLSNCKDGIGGIEDMLIVDFETMQTGVTYDEATGEITALPTATLYRYVPYPNTGGFSQQAQINDTNVAINQVGTVTIGPLSPEKKLELDVVIRKKVVIFIRLKKDNKIVVLGLQSGAFVTAFSANAGTAVLDVNAYVIEWTAIEQTQAPFLEDYTSVPFDNFVTITVSPAYGATS